MSATTVNAFPPLHALNSPRAWFLALIVLLHAGFFWALTHGVTIGNVTLKTGGIMIIDELPPPDQPVPQKPRDVVLTDVTRIWVPDPIIPHFEQVDDSSAPVVTSPDPQPPVPDVIRDAPGSGPVIVEPMIDPRIALSEPEYPVSSIRQQHEGTVLLSIEILPNGRVGQVRVEQSSGYARLDESAAREARKWRMKPGTQDGVATAMWKRVPVTFKLKN